VVSSGALARPPEGRLALLARGVNITNWFRFPPSAEPARMDAYLSYTAMAALRASGFSFVRLPVQPALAAHPSLERAIRRLRGAGLAVVVALAGPAGDAEEARTAGRVWARLAPVLRRIDRVAIFPELLNEPVFAGAAGAWNVMQADMLRDLRVVWPEATVILTGAAWGGIDGLLAVVPPADSNVVFSIHVYDPSVLTSLAAFEPGLDRAALAGLPFPVVDTIACPRGQGRTRAVAAFYCAQGWDEARLADRLALAAAWARRHDAAILVGEFGAGAALNTPARLAWLAAARHAFATENFGWALWGLEDVMGFNLPRPPPEVPVLDVDLLRALALPGPPRL